MKCQFLDFVYEGSIPMQVAAAWFEESIGKGEWFEGEMPEDSEFVCHLRQSNVDMYYDNDRKCYFVARKVNINENTMKYKKRINENYEWEESENMPYDINNVKMWYDKLVALLPTIEDEDKKYEVECVLGSLETCLEDPSELMDWDMQYLQDGFLRNLYHDIENNSDMLYENTMKYTRKEIHNIVAEQFMKVLRNKMNEEFDMSLENDKRNLKFIYQNICQKLKDGNLTPEERKDLEGRKKFIEQQSMSNQTMPRKGSIMIGNKNYAGDIYSDADRLNEGKMAKVITKSIRKVLKENWDNEENMATYDEWSNYLHGKEPLFEFADGIVYVDYDENTGCLCSGYVTNVGFHKDGEVEVPVYDGDFQSALEEVYSRLSCNHEDFE